MSLKAPFDCRDYWFWDKRDGKYYLDLENADTVAQLKVLPIRKLNIAFYIPTRYEIRQRPLTLWSIFLAEGLTCPYDHCEIWLDDIIAIGTRGLSRGAVQAELLKPLAYDGNYDVVELPNMKYSPEIVDILVNMRNAHAKYHARIWHFLIAPHDWLLRHDYSSSDTRTWTHGITCSQFVILFLKECQLRGFAPSLPSLQDIESSTCLPSHIMEILLATSAPLIISRNKSSL